MDKIKFRSFRFNRLTIHLPLCSRLIKTNVSNYDQYVTGNIYELAAEMRGSKVTCNSYLVCGLVNA